MDAYNGFNNSTNSWSGMTSLDQYRERVTYDGNGNILTYSRNGHKSGGNLVMDNLTYNYSAGTNKLLRVDDAVTNDNRYGSAAGDVADIDDQAGTNYEYDEIGNLVKDVKEGLTSVKWSLYGKILEINRTANAANPISKITYTYDAQGNRISKTVLKNTGNKTHTWYVRDAQGNVLAMYTSQGNPSNLGLLSLNVSERHLYGSSRLGLYSGVVNVDGGPKDMTDSNSTKYYRGLKQYELNNHLGNVLATISDKKIGVDEGSDGSIDYYDADVKTAQDYYPFGMMMPGRIGFKNGSSWSGETGEVAPDAGPAADIAIDGRSGNQPAEYTATHSVEFVRDFESEDGDTFIAYISEAEEGEGGSGSGSSLNGNYRYGFNGKEMDNEPKGTGNQYDYGFRIYDPRIGRFLSLDPLQKKYPELTPYQFSSNRPIDGFDLDGREYVTFGVEITAGALGKPSFRRFIIQDFRQLSAETMATIHGEPSYAEDFYERFSESFGPEGKGFKWIYYNDKGQQLGEPVWQMKQSGLIVENSGYYSGAGSITKYGPGLSTGHFAELGNDYDFGYEPMGYSDRISKKHDQIQQKEIKQPQGWLEDVRTLRSDKILLTDIDRGLIWEEANSKEDFSRLVNMRAFFTAVVAYKKWKVNEMNERRLDKNDPKNQLKIILSDWKPKTFSAQWYLKKVLEGSGGGAAEKNRNTVKPTQQTSP